MLRPLLTAAAVCLIAAAPAAHAELSYSYVDGALFVNSTDTSLGEQDGTGIEGSFSYDILSYLHVFAGAKYAELDDLPIDSTLIEAGAGVHYNFSSTGSLYFNLAALSIDSDLTVGGSSVSADDDGYGYAFGYRESTKTGNMEFNLSAEHRELSDADTGDTWINMGLLFRVTPRFEVITGVQFAGDENLFKVGVRYYLPNRFAAKE
jgi:hypothetical protein